MILSMNEQFFLFFISIAMGIAGGLIYGLICIFRKYIVHNIAGIYVEDFFYWILFAIAFFIVMLYFNYADIRPYMFLGLFIGLILYYIFIHKIVIKILSPFIALLRLFAEIVLTPVMLVLYPFKKIYEYFEKGLKKNPKYEKIKCNLLQKCKLFKKR